MQDPRRPGGGHDGAIREVMIVDDDAAAREFMALVLSIEGYRASAFADGESFLEAFDARVRDGLAPLCVLLDVLLPGRSGLDVLRVLAARRLALPVFMMSGQADIATAVAAIRAGAADFIEKPFAVTAMLGCVRKALLTHRRSALPDAIPAANC